MAIDVTLAIDPTAIGAGKTTASVAVDLIPLGGSLVAWRPEMSGAPARATFAFETETSREQFLVGALKTPGVYVATRQ